MLIELLNLKNDYVFKRIFGHIGSERITKQMLSTIIQKPINTVKLDENTILEKELLEDRVGIIDIHAKIDDKIDVDIEMQVVKQYDIEKRIMFYWSKLYTQGIISGENYESLNKTIAILITDSKIPKLNKIPEYYTKWQIREEKYQSVILTDVLEIYIIELPKVVESQNSRNVEIRPWLEFIENPEKAEMIGMSKENAVAIKEAKKLLEEISKDEHERYLAHLREKYIRDQKAIKRTGYNEGLTTRNKSRRKEKSNRNIKENVTTKSKY